jgi:ferredoxin
MAMVGLPLCDLQALWYLDQVFVDDAHYRERRSRLFVAGALCEPGPECRCDAALMPVAGDLVIGPDHVWALSASGTELLTKLGCHMQDKSPLPWPGDPADKRSTFTAEEFRAHRHAGVWAAEGDRCLSCGACSAVCPTCYCFDLLDVAEVDGSVKRQRLWDNCFFADHGRVAGGFDFRAGRAERLRFRMEHKRLGFGELHGVDSCVGCGRCRNICPVEIDLDRIAEQFLTEMTDA